MLADLDLLPPAFWIVALALFGLAIGSFLNVVIYRLPREESIVSPASHCGSCDAPVKSYDNIPILSYAVLGGRCRACRARISPRYPLVEALTAVLFVALIVPLMFIDADVMLLPNKITHPGLLFAIVTRGFVPNLYGFESERFGVGWFLGLGDSPDWYVSLAGAAAGGTLGGGGLLFVGWVWKVVRGRWGMGLGDVSMMCMVGAYLGWQLTLLTIMVASLLGSIVGVTYALVRGRDLQVALPFGVFLGAGALIALFAGQEILNWYITRQLGM